ncbi:MAG: transcription-repair coupling factor [Deltaproteobacteria bacterium]|nr:transcription-repair coupling factor [Deltaproteobacteria bacterium]
MHDAARARFLPDVLPGPRASIDLIVPCSPHVMSTAGSAFFSEKTTGRALLDAIRQGAFPLYASGVRGSSSALAASLLFDALRRPLCLITPTREEADELFAELLFFRNQEDHPGCDVCLFPPPDTRPYEQVLIHCDVSARRLWTLYRLCDAATPLITVTCVRSLLQRVVPPDILIDACRDIRRGDTVDRDALLQALVASGYTRVNLVEDRGDISVRGDIIDMYPPGYTGPVRIDLFGDTVESLRLFDPRTQRSRSDIDRAHIVPVREMILSPDVVSKFIARAQDNPQVFSGSRRRAFVENLASGFLPAGSDYCLPLVYAQTAALHDYLSGDTLAIWCDPDESGRRIAALEQDVMGAYQAACEEHRAAAEPGAMFLPFETPEESCLCGQRLYFESWAMQRTDAQVVFATQANEDIRQELLAADSSEGVLTALAGRIEGWIEDGFRVLVACTSTGQCERLAGLFTDYGLKAVYQPGMSFAALLERPLTGSVEMFTGTIARGFRTDAGRLVLLTEQEIFGEKKRRSRSARLRSGTALSDFSDLKPGDYIVHRDSGIGIYCGLETLNAGGVRADYLRLEYLGGDRLFLPVDRITLINKYECAEDAPPKLDRLGGTAWQRTKRRVRESVEKIARELLELYSVRKVARGHAFAPIDHYYREFEAAFAFEETPDQAAAIQDVMQDMSSERPMDRLVCGDVGYGKTEVALRAAFRAAMNGKQTAVFVPTTILAQQHYQTFRSRLAPYPVRVEIISRFRSPKDQRRIIAELARGAIDVVIGTHRLVSRDVVFKDLGLLVIDEEHRFGVKQKEKIKQLKSMVDVLTLTATPIPRTLQMSLFGVRDFSTIETPPQDRMSIRTVIAHFDETLIREAIMRELTRGGQVFFVHDRVRSIESMAVYLRRLVPEMRLGIAHGQMNEHQLEDVMLRFVRSDVNVLLCTTIIESGLDFPSANTIIINNAHRLGLAQMYQLRGRVGRGKVRAYACLLVPASSSMSPEAAKRLEALSEFSELGSGYRLATRDLQIRGAGNILGHAQSGHMASVGMDMYLELLADTIAAMKGEQARPRIDPEVNLQLQAYIPEDYVSDVNQRLVLYRRIAAVLAEEETFDIEAEMRDRYGVLPPQAGMLLEVARLRSALRSLLITAVDYYRGCLVFSFHDDAAEQLDHIVRTVSADPARFQFTPEMKLLARVGPGAELTVEVRSVLNRLQSRT